MEDLPTEFDVVVLGTGLPESIIAAAASRVDKSVLQLDANGFYGRDWAGFRLQDLRDFLKGCGASPEQNTVKDVSHLLNEGESVIWLGTPADSITNSEEVIYIRDDVVETDIAPQSRLDRQRRRSGRLTSDSSNHSTGSSPSRSSPATSPMEDPFPEPIPRKRFTFGDVLLLTRKFSLDLAPKLFWTTDDFVSLLTSSNISRYASFRLVHSVATYLDGRIVEVPFSRSAISNHAELGALDKRKVMKFMQVCMEYGSNPTKETIDPSLSAFGDYLNSLKIPSDTQRSIINAIALCTANTPTEEAFLRVNRFLSACGRYDKTSSPFLFSIYGCGEFPQYFARISAVFGGIQCLKRGVDAVVTNATGSHVVAVISENQRISCHNLVIPVEHAPEVWRQGGVVERNYSRAILITDTSIFPTRPSDVGFMRFPRDNDELGVILIEASAATEVCPSGYFVVYLWSHAVASARTDLEPYVMKLFEPFRADRVAVPKVLWATFFNHKHASVPQNNTFASGDPVSPSGAPGNVRIVSGPSGSLDYEDVLKESKGVFTALYPGVAFLPRVPDPEEIVLDGGDSPSLPMDASPSPVDSSGSSTVQYVSSV